MSQGRRPRTLVWLGACTAAAALLLAASTPAGSFRKLRVGDRVENLRLRALDGGREPLLRADRRANVFVFFRPDQRQSAGVLEELAACEREFAEHSVHWALVVSERTPPEELRPLLELSLIHI